MKAITTKFHGPTNSKGSRYSAIDSDNNRVTLSTDYALNSDENHRRAAVALCEKMGWKGAESLIGGGTKEGMVFVFAPTAPLPGALKATLQVACAFLEHPDVNAMPFSMSPAASAKAIREYLEVA